MHCCREFWRRSFTFGAVLGALIAPVAAAITADAPSESADERVVLPLLKVDAQVPLQKIDEHRMLAARFAPAAVVRDGFIYIIGGLNDTGPLASIERFNTVTGHSELFATLRVARFWHGAAIVRGRLYVFGGRSIESRHAASAASIVSALPLPRGDHGPALERIAPDTNEPAPAVLVTGFELSTEIVDLETGAVTQGPAMPDGRSQFGCVALRDRIYVLGGERGRGDRFSHTNRVEILDPDTGQWSDGLPLPTPRLAPAMLVHGPFIVVPGGYDGRHAMAEVVAYDPAAHRWLLLPQLCRLTSAHSAVFLRNHLFLFGDYTHPDELLAYDLRTKTSETFVLHYTPSRHNAAVVSGNRIYVIGGKARRFSSPSDVIQVFELTK